MENSLIAIKNDIEKYTNVITDFINVDVGIVDKNMKRIFGTGMHRLKNKRAMGTVYKNTLKTGKINIIKNPRKHELCASCLDRDNCHEELEIATPIYCDEKIIGVLGVISFDKEQKEIIVNNLEAYIHLTKQIAEFIGVKFYEYQEKKLQIEKEKTLNQILNNLNKGVLVIDSNDFLLIVNEAGRKKLNFLDDTKEKKVLLKSQENTILGEEIFKLYINRKEYDVAGKIIPVTLPDNKKGNAFIFENIQKINKDLLDFSSLENTINLNDIIGESLQISLLKNKINRIKDSTSTVLITGESGTGKELVARSLHSEGNRKDKPFVTINCSAIPDSLLESELFGYAKGAFTGANPNGRMGKFELANNGIIFLDEIGDMPLYLQAKILRVIENKKIERIGSNKSIDLDIRIIAATNVDLIKNIEEKKFRKDLYYRLNVLPIKIPPLRDRKEDIVPIVKKVLEKHNKISEKSILHIEKEVFEILKNYSWPGNVRELENTIEFMFNTSSKESVISLRDIPDNILKNKELNERNNLKREVPIILNNLENFEKYEKRYIKRALELYGSDTEGKKIVSEKMNIGLTTLYRKLKRYEL